MQVLREGTVLHDHVGEAKGSFAEELTHLAVSSQLKCIPGRRNALCEDEGCAQKLNELMSVAQRGEM